MSDEQAFPIILSVPTSGAGATPAATFAFFTMGYQPPRQLRAKTSDTIKNQNGLHKYDYDNGPGPNAWKPFEIAIVNDFQDELLDRGATQMWADLQFLWNYVEGPMGMEAPEGVYSVSWAEGMALERQFLARKGAAGDKARTEARVVVEFEES